jgi:hypothetical protein
MQIKHTRRESVPSGVVPELGTSAPGMLSLYHSSLVRTFSYSQTDGPEVDCLSPKA